MGDFLNTKATRSHTGHKQKCKVIIILKGHISCTSSLLSMFRFAKIYVYASTY